MNAKPPRPAAFAHKPRAKKLVPSEEVEQQMLVRLLRLRRIRFFAVPNGGHRHPAVAAKLKACGVERGVPDIVITDAPHGLFGIAGTVVEMKRSDGVPSDVSAEQKDWLAHFEKRSWRSVVGFGFDDAVKKLRAIGYEL